jgi:hypothetical protein
MSEKRNDNEGEESFLQKLFSCCLEKSDKELELEREATNSFLGNSKYTFENELSLFPTNMIRPEEKNKIKFTKDELVDYIINLQNLVFPVIYDDNSTIKISKRNFTELSEKVPLIRIELTKNKMFFTQIPSIQQMVRAITNPELRTKWDKSIKEYKIMGKIKKESEIVKTVTNKQLSVISEKEFYDKRVGIIKDNVYYLFSSSIPDENYPINISYDRAKNYMSIMVIKEDEDNFYFDCFIQVDINIKMPMEFIEANLLNKANNFFDKYFEFLNIIKY